MALNPKGPSVAQFPHGTDTSSGIDRMQGDLSKSCQREKDSLLSAALNSSQMFAPYD